LRINLLKKQVIKNPVTYSRSSPMMKHILAGCSLLVAVAVSSLPAQAQNAPAPAAKPAPATQTAPAAKPAPVTQTAPAASPAPTKPATTQEKVSPEELKKFASATKQLLAIVNDTESQMVQAVEKQGSLKPVSTKSTSRSKTPVLNQLPKSPPKKRRATSKQ
jgi:hypothetical protein